LDTILRITGARLLQAVLVAVVVGIVSFIMMQALRGDSAYRIAAARYGYDVMDAQATELVRQELGLERPLYLQLVHWLQQLVSLNLGNSLVSGNPVWVYSISFDSGVRYRCHFDFASGCAVKTLASCRLW